MRKIVLVFAVLFFVSVQAFALSQFSSYQEEKKDVARIIAEKYGQRIKRIREFFLSYLRQREKYGKVRMTKNTIYTITFTNFKQGEKVCPTIEDSFLHQGQILNPGNSPLWNMINQTRYGLSQQYGNIAALRMLAQNMQYKYGNLYSILSRVANMHTETTISTDYAHLIYQGSRNLFLLSRKYNPKTLADLWFTLYPKRNIYPQTTPKNCIDVARYFIASAVENIRQKKQVSASLCVLRCLSSQNYHVCLNCLDNKEVKQ